jgi:hypothetical protein
MISFDESTNRKESLIFFSGSFHNLNFYRYLLFLVSKLLKENSRVTIVRTRKHSIRNISGYYRRYVPKRFDDNFFEALKRAHGSKINILVDKSEVVRFPKVDYSRTFAQLSERERVSLENSIRSYFSTDVYDSEYFPKTLFRHSRLKQKLERSFLFSLDICKKLDKWADFEDVFVINGRRPDQAAVRSYFEGKGKKIWYFENGRPHGRRVFIADFQRQEVRKMSEWLADQSRSVSLDSFTLLNNLNAWLEKIGTKSIVNPHLAEPITDGTTIENIVPFFTSSLDERFSNLGADLNGWNSQIDAILSVNSRLREAGFNLIVRLHPNLMNKSWFDVSFYVKSLEAANIKFILPWQPGRSQELIGKSRFSLSWASTTSLEAAALGKPAINFGPHYYSDILGITTLNPGLLADFDFEIERPLSIDRAAMAHYCLQNFGLLVENWELNESENEISKLIEFLSEKSSSQGRALLFGMIFEFLPLSRLSRFRWSSPRDLQSILRRMGFGSTTIEGVLNRILNSFLKV